MALNVTLATRRRVFLAALLLGALAWTMTISAPSSVAAPTGNCTYYSSPSHKVVVGRFGYDCCNNYIAEGTTSPYYECGGCFICYPPPPSPEP
jgi:hypothetical protein